MVVANKENEDTGHFGEYKLVLFISIFLGVFFIALLVNKQINKKTETQKAHTVFLLSGRVHGK